MFVPTNSQFKPENKQRFSSQAYTPASIFYVGTVFKEHTFTNDVEQTQSKNYFRVYVAAILTFQVHEL